MRHRVLGIRQSSANLGISGEKPEHKRDTEKSKMAMHIPKAPGFAQMLKEGARVSLKC